eukprot:TRINITY_DN930_c0_g1_i5.p1 TRINITY_DN930_c0_g1~~TRINITY_DN930_c0_g1_i5.p1  ORF type:complete len:646 (-),score=127.55 TRINITY_DN930_c0_g1_i5:780-2717(-)
MAESNATVEDELARRRAEKQEDVEDEMREEEEEEQEVEGDEEAGKAEDEEIEESESSDEEEEEEEAEQVSQDIRKKLTDSRGLMLEDGEDLDMLEKLEEQHDWRDRGWITCLRCTTDQQIYCASCLLCYRCGCKERCTEADNATRMRFTEPRKEETLRIRQERMSMVATHSEAHERLIQACRRGEVDKIIEYTSDVRVDVVDNLGNTPIYYSILCGHYAAVQTLFRLGAKVNMATPDGQRYYLAAQNPAVRELVRQNSTFTVPTSNSSSSTSNSKTKNRANDAEKQSEAEKKRKKKKIVRPDGDWFSNLPIDCLSEIMEYLTDRELMIAAQVCSSWRDIAESNFVWRPLWNKLFGGSIALPAVIPGDQDQKNAWCEGEFRTLATNSAALMIEEQDTEVPSKQELTSRSYKEAYVEAILSIRNFKTNYEDIFLLLIDRGLKVAMRLVMSKKHLRKFPVVWNRCNLISSQLNEVCKWWDSNSSGYIVTSAISQCIKSNKVEILAELLNNYDEFSQRCRSQSNQFLLITCVEGSSDILQLIWSIAPAQDPERQHHYFNLMPNDYPTRHTRAVYYDRWRIHPQTLPHIAIICRNPDVAVALCVLEPRFLEVVDHNGQTPLMVLLSCGYLQQVYKSLLIQYLVWNSILML